MTWVTTPVELGGPEAASRLPRAVWNEEPAWDDRRVLVVEPRALGALGTAAAMEGYLWIALESPRPAHRGKLALHIEESIESALQARGAPPPGVGASTDLDASLGDQLYRARLVEMRGVALGVPDLGGIANLGGVLDSEDSAALRWWIAAAMDRPVRVVLSSDNRAYRVYPSPVAFGALLDGLSGSFRDAPSPRAPSTETAQSVAAMELSDLPPNVGPAPSDLNQLSLGAGVELPELDQALGLEGAKQVVSEPAAAEPAATEPAGSAPSAPEQAIEAAVEPVATEPVAPEQAVEAAVEPAATEPAAPEQAVEAAVEPAATEPAVAEGPVEQAAADAPAPAESASEPVESGVPAAPTDEADEADDSAADAVLAALSSPAAPEAAAVPAERASSPVRRPIIKSSISMPAARQASASSRLPFIMSAEDAEELEAGSEAATEAPAADVAAADDDVAAEPVVEERPATTSPVEEPAQEPTQESVAAETPASSEPVEDPFDSYAQENWKSWVRELESARGPKPLALIERLYVTAYTRLQMALERGIADDSAREAIEQWGSSFAKSYTEAFDALRVRGKRPTMVLDVPELAQRVGRLHGARRVQLLLVDAMRFDLGMMVQDRLKQRAEASLTERMLLWSALPTTTTQQLELIGKGADGLREMTAHEEEAPAVVARGRAAHTLRRIRTGRRELVKLDIVEAALRELGEDESPGRVRDRLPAIADDVSAVIADYFAKQAPRTLVVVFGDHGFRLDDGAPASQQLSSGGASPEEVLVPAFAWLTGATH